MNTQINSQSGNALVIIFIAVALFAALGAAFSSNSRQSTNLITDVQAEAYASEIIAFGNDVKNAIKRMRLSGVKIEEIDFTHPTILRYVSPPSPFPGNPNCTDSKCKVFHSEGGGLTPKIFEDLATPHIISQSSTRPQAGHPWLYRTNVENVGTSKNDLTMHILRIPRNICEQINKKLGLSDNIIDQGEGFGSKGNFIFYNIDDAITGVFSNVLGNNITELNGKKSGCYNEDSNLSFSYFVVIEAR